MSRAIIVSPPGCPFELSPFNEHKSGKLVHSNSYVDDICYACISGQDGVSHARVVAPPYCPFELSRLTEL